MVILSDEGRYLEENPTVSLLTPKQIACIRKKGGKVIDMNTGHPRKVSDHELRDLDKKLRAMPIDYAPPEGYPDVRETIARYGNYIVGELENKDGLKAENVCVTANGTNAFSAGIQLFVPRGSHGIAMVPCYGPYLDALYAQGATVSFVQSEPETGFIPTLDDSIKEYEKYADRTSYFVFLSGNPTGFGLYKDKAQEMAEVGNYIARKSKGRVFLQFDEVYHQLSLDDDHRIYTYLNPEARRCSGTVISASKILAMTGEVGAMLLPDERLQRIMARKMKKDRLTSPAVEQRVFAAGLEKIMSGKWKGEGSLEESAHSYIGEVRFVMDGLKSLAEACGVAPEILSPYNPNKALYAFPRIGSLFIGRKVPDIKIFEDESLREFVFGKSGEDTIRTDAHIEKLILAMAGTQYGTGVIGRCGSSFVVNPELGFMRFTCTRTGNEGRREHQEFLGVIYDAMILLGVRPNKSKEELFGRIMVDKPSNLAIAGKMSPAITHWEQTLAQGF